MLDGIFDGISSIMDKILFFFPESPFQNIIVNFEMENYLNYINWFIPFDKAVDITQMWLIGIFAWKVYGSIFTKVKGG